MRTLCWSRLPSVFFRCMSNILTSHILPICVQYPYRTCIFDLYVSNILTGHVCFKTFVRVVFGRSLSGVCLISLLDIFFLYVFNIITEHVYFDLYVSNILTGQVYFETFVRVVFGWSLSSVCLISLPDICSLYVFNILAEHVYSIFVCPISLPGMYISKPLLESSSVGLFPVYV